ncbi:hypothetical protein MMC29_004549, partial [Sticta canariensis]|nr:hypothetical protein [Sticta canariensis]
MPGFKHLFSTLCLTALVLPLTSAQSSPTRSFTVQAYESPQPDTPLINYYLVAQGGTFYLTKQAPRPRPTLSVDRLGAATLSGGGQVYLDTTDGHLGYTTSTFPPGAVTVDFLHLGSGTTPSLPTSSHVPGEPGGIFVWIGSDNRYWFACPANPVTGAEKFPGGRYKLFKVMTNTVPDVSNCQAVELAALDV